jgi:hypothetical protein
MWPSFAIVPSDAMSGSGHGNAAQTRPSLLPGHKRQSRRRNDTGTLPPFIHHLRTRAGSAARIALCARSGPERYPMTSSEASNPRHSVSLSNGSTTART